MIGHRSKISYDNRGSALIIALVVSAVLMVLSLSLLAVSYSLYLSQKNNTGGINEKEMFYSAIEIFEEELMNGGHNVFDENVNDATKEAYPDNGLFGSKLVNSIFDYNASDNKEDVNLWKCFDSNAYNEKETEEDKATYIKSVSRYFKMKCYGAFSINIQMYWEFKQQQIELNGDSSADPMDGILLHVVYRLTKNNDTMIKNERVYRLCTSLKGAKPVNPTSEGNNGEGGTEQGGAGQDQTEQGGTGQGEEVTEEVETEEPKYMVKLGVCKLGVEANTTKYMVDPDFFPNLEVSTTNPKYPYIMVSEAEWGNSIFDKEEYNYINSIADWYTGTKTNVRWDGKPQSLRNQPDKSGKDIPIARTDWGKRVPVRIKFVVNGCYIDIKDIYKYCYIKHVDWNTTEIKEQNFKEDELMSIINDQILEVCGVKISEKDNSGSIKWLLKDGNNYYDFFENGVPVIKHKDETNMGKSYYVYATFPSYYKESDYTNLDKSKIKQYTDGNIINLDDVCYYKMYSFERIIRQ